MNLKTILGSLTLSAFVFLGAAAVTGTATTATMHTAASCIPTATTVCPSDGGAGNG